LSLSHRLSGFPVLSCPLATFNAFNSILWNALRSSMTINSTFWHKTAQRFKMRINKTRLIPDRYQGDLLPVRGWKMQRSSLEMMAISIKVGRRKTDNLLIRWDLSRFVEECNWTCQNTLWCKRSRCYQMSADRICLKYGSHLSDFE
jgi:hypothetical protein